MQKFVHLQCNTFSNSIYLKQSQIVTSVYNVDFLSYEQSTQFSLQQNGFQISMQLCWRATVAGQTVEVVWLSCCQSLNKKKQISESTFPTSLHNKPPLIRAIDKGNFDCNFFHFRLQTRFSGNGGRCNEKVCIVMLSQGRHHCQPPGFSFG